jgi:hypothetical protein
MVYVTCDVCGNPCGGQEDLCDNAGMARSGEVFMATDIKPLRDQIADASRRTQAGAQGRIGRMDLEGRRGVGRSHRPIPRTAR